MILRCCLVQRFKPVIRLRWERVALFSVWLDRSVTDYGVNSSGLVQVRYRSPPSAIRSGPAVPNSSIENQSAVVPILGQSPPRAPRDSRVHPCGRAVCHGQQHQPRPALRLLSDCRGAGNEDEVWQTQPCACARGARRDAGPGDEALAPALAKMEKSCGPPLLQP